MENKDKIRVLTDREQSREKLPIFYGSRENYLHGFKEILNNAVDEINNNFSKGIIVVTLHEDLKTISISDTGRGIPIEGTTDGKPNYELLFETLFAGTNYDNAEQGKIAGGTNGVGATVLNYTSTLFKVTSIRGGKKYQILYKDGGIRQGDIIEDKADENLHGSIFTFKLDPEVYTKTEYDPYELKNIVKKISAAANKIVFKFRFNNEETIFHYDNIQDYFNEINEKPTSKPAGGPLVSFERDNEYNKITILFSTSSSPVQESFLNMIWLSEKGAIHNGVIQGVRMFINKYALEKKMIDKKLSISSSDVEDSLSYVASVLSTNVEYANQTKLSTNKTLYARLSSQYVEQALEVMLAEQPKEFEKFVKHIIEVSKFNNKNTEAKQQLKKKLQEKVDTISNRVENLIDCSIHGEEAELFIAEGQSALGSIVLARDGKYQAAYPLRGKILNCLKADYATIFKNTIITDLIKVLGCGIQADKKNKDLESFDESNLRFGKIIIATDADPDGGQIAALIITMFYRLIPSLIENGRIYIAKTPLYELKYDNDEMIYFYTEKEKEDKIKDVKGKYTISRCKGLGELSAETMAFTAMDPNTRNLEKITVDDAKKMSEMVEMFMGTEIEGRREYIEQNIYKYIDNVLDE